MDRCRYANNKWEPDWQASTIAPKQPAPTYLGVKYQVGLFWLQGQFHSEQRLDARNRLADTYGFNRDGLPQLLKSKDHLKVHVTFLQNNTRFNQAYADEYHWGEDSESNRKHDWLTRLKVAGPVKEIRVNREVPYQLNRPGKEDLFPAAVIEGMTICECVLANGGVVIFGASASLLERVVHPNGSALQLKAGTNKTSHVYFYFKPGSQFVSPWQGIYIASTDMPAA